VGYGQASGTTEDPRRTNADMPTDRDVERERFVQLRRTGSAALRDELVADHLWLARHGARRFAGRGEARDDLVQVASLALVNAVDRFDPELGVRFATYAMPTIVGELRRHFRDRSWSVRVARRLKDLHVELRSAKEELTHVLGRAPTVDELADFVDASPDEVLEALEAGAAYRAGTLSTGPVGTDGQELDEPAVLGAPDEELDAAPERVEVLRALQSLPERDRKVVYLSFYAGLTQSEIADEVGVSQVHVSRILRSCLARLGEELAGAMADPL
jgi:RNA polymerase sigma-B factor